MKPVEVASLWRALFRGEICREPGRPWSCSIGGPLSRLRARKAMLEKVAAEAREASVRSAAGRTP